MGVATIKDFGEEIGQQPHELGREDEGLHRGCELLHGDGHVTDLAAGDPGDLADRLREGQKPRGGYLTELSRVPLLRQRRDRHIREVLGVYERLGHAIDRDSSRFRENRLRKKLSLKFWLKNWSARSSTPRRTP